MLCLLALDHTSLGNCTSLKITNLEDNDLIGEVPLKTENLQNLMQLSFTNSSLTGLIPYAIFNSSKIEVIGLYMNYFSGHLPSSMGHLLPNLKALYLWENELNGIIPNSISNASKFINLQLGANHFSGSIPNTLENLRHLDVLNLASNNFTSESSTLELMFLSYLTKCINLTSIVVANNPLNGTLPISIGNFSTSLEQFVAYNCSIKGIIPIGIGNLSNLVTLYLEDNELVGSIPTTDGIMRLQRLHLQDNRLQGLIPNDICQLNNLDELFLNHNELFGTIPTCWGGLSKLQKLYLDSNHLKDIQQINLSLNYLSGHLPSNVGNLEHSFMGNKALCGPSKLQVPPCKTSNVGQSRTSTAIIVRYILPTMIATILALVLSFALMKDRKRYAKLKELEQATNRFSKSNLIGKGDFGSVYKGTLSDGVSVAIKSFEAECDVLRIIRHQNLVKIINSCSIIDFKALVLEYMPNGSLMKWLYSHNSFLDILQRLNAIIDVESSLEYLHHECPSPIVHCDLKPNNILLNKDMVAHVSDFGISKLLGDEDSIGYMAPGDYGSQEIISTRGDVKQSLPHSIIEVVDANLLKRGEEHFNSKLDYILSIMELARHCITASLEERINIRDIVTTLENIKLKFLKYVGGD
ncbi:hypothetical protein ACJW31_03G054500 [Castanea mollissima]